MGKLSKQDVLILAQESLLSGNITTEVGYQLCRGIGAVLGTYPVAVHRRRKGGLEPPQYFSGGGRASPNILGLVLADI